jgi:hypothetical protein
MALKKVQKKYKAPLYKFLMSHTTKKIGILQSVFEKADSPPPRLPRKGSRLAKSICAQSSKTVFIKTVDSFPHLFVLNTGSRL